MERSCPFVYAYEEHGHTFMGCMQKVFEVEIDVEMLRAAERRREGFGAVRATRQPLPMCHSEVDPCYAHRAGELGCVNPEFNELPAGSPTFRVFAAALVASGTAAAPRSDDRPERRERERGAPRVAVTTAANAGGDARGDTAQQSSAGSRALHRHGPAPAALRGCA